MMIAFLYPDPVPGACNVEFPLENDPNLLIPDKRLIDPVQFQYANTGIQRHQVQCPICLTLV